MPSRMVPVSEAKAHLTELVRDAEDGEVTLLRHGRPVAYIVSVERQDALLERLEDAEDRLALYESDGVARPFSALMGELDPTEVEVRAGELAKVFEDHEPDEDNIRDATALRDLRAAVLNRAEVEASVASAVNDARAEGHTWAAVGAMLGSSGEAARQRYGVLARSWTSVRAEASDAGLIDERRVAAASKMLHEKVQVHKPAEIRKGQCESDALGDQLS